MQGWIKLNRSEEAEYLFRYPNANHLLNIIAQRARRTDHKLNGLKVGQAFIGDFKDMGLTEREYRTAKKRLTGCGIVTFKGTSKGTIATLVNSTVYDINIDEVDDQKDGRVTSTKTGYRRTVDGRVTTNKECKNGRMEEGRIEEVKTPCSATPNPTQKTKNQFADQEKQVLGYLLERTGRKFTNGQGLTKRLAEGYTVHDCQLVIWRKAEEWMNTKDQKYLRPSTLFQPSKFEGYLNDAKQGVALQKESNQPETVDETKDRIIDRIDRLTQQAGNTYEQG